MQKQQHIEHSIYVDRDDLLSPECVVDVGRKLVIVKFEKKLAFRDIERYTAWLRANPLFQWDFSEIVDLSAVEEFDLQADDFLKLADDRDPFSHQAKRAFVAQTSAQTHAARMHKMLRGQRSFEIFSTLQEAESWIAS